MEDTLIKPSKPELFMVFDVESIGLHGEGFAFGYVVIKRDGTIVEEDLFSCFPDVAMGEAKNRKWIKANVPSLAIRTLTTRGVRDAFWECWMRWKAVGAVLIAECAWPVEANFLEMCVEDSPVEREWEGPYPLHDLVTLMLARGLDPMTSYPRLKNELPAHNPLNDARQSARLFIELLNIEK